MQEYDIQYALSMSCGDVITIYPDGVVSLENVSLGEMHIGELKATVSMLENLHGLYAKPAVTKPKKKARK